MGLISILEAGRRDFLEAAGDVSPELAPVKVGSHWSVLECIEHVVIAEDRYLSWILAGTEIVPQRDAEKELRLFSILRSRLTKVEARETFRPVGRLTSLAAAVAEFEAVRDRSVQVVRERGEQLYSIGARHPFFGDVNGVELVQMMDGHARRHAEQIRDTCELLERPVARRFK